MFKLIDRQLVRGYFKAYAICLTSLISLYIVVDLFTNLDDFTQHGGGLANSARLIGIYYGYKVTEIFDRLCEAILLMAAMFTVAWMQRSNEQLPMLSAGVSTQRLVAPVIVSACLMLTLTVLNQELLIPHIGWKLTNQRDDPDGEKDVAVKAAYEPNGIHIHGGMASRQGNVIRKFQCVIPAEMAGRLLPIAAEEARYVPPGEGPRTGGWELIGTQPEEIERGENTNLPLEQIDKGKFFLKVSRVDFDALTRHEKAYLWLSTFELFQDLRSPDAARPGSSGLDRKKAVLFHTRLTRPLLGLILVFLGLSIILRDQNRNVFISAGMCLVLCAFFFALTFACRFLGESNILSPPLAAWLPVLMFGPFALVNFDAVQT